MQAIEPFIALRRYSPQVSYEMRRIDAALSRINTAEILPAAAEALRFAAQVGTIHYSTLIEGNRLGVLEAQRAARGELDRTTKAEIELINYVDALGELDRRFEVDGLTFDEQLFLDIHREATKGLGGENGPFKPHHEGTWRDGEVGVFDPISGLLVHEGSSQIEVRPRMLGLIDWINAKVEQPIEWPVPVLAGVLHFNIVEIHPFADGNGRTARLLTMAMLMRAGYAPHRLFNFDAHYGKAKDAYLDALRSVRRETLNQETWQRYFLAGLADEYERVAGEVDRLSAIGRTADGQKIQLTTNEQKALTDLKLRGISEFTRMEYQQAAGVSRNTANAEVNRLASRGVLRRLGDGSARRYRFPNAAPINPWTGRGGGRPRQWTDEQIERELAAMVGDSGRFPPVKAFREAGNMALYGVIVRRGGTGAWARRLGIVPPRGAG
jgi:Fic family protein